MRARLLFVVIGIACVAPTRAKDYPGVGPLEDSEEHWDFEFEISNDNPLGTKEDTREIRSLCRAEAKHVSHAGLVGSIFVRWVSASQTIVRVYDGAYDPFSVSGLPARKGKGGLFVLEKKKGNWLIVHRYQNPVILKPKDTQQKDLTRSR